MWLNSEKRFDEFMIEIRVKDSRSMRVRVAALAVAYADLLQDTLEPSELCGVNVLKCWNCGEMGHTYMDCTGPRKVFCFG